MRARYGECWSHFNLFRGSPKKEGAMLKKLFILVLCALGLGSYVQPVETRAETEGQSLDVVSQAVPSENDQRLTEVVRTALKEDTFLSRSLKDVQLKTVNSIVYLKGTVASEKEKAAIEERTRACRGVAGVHSFIRVVSFRG